MPLTSPRSIELDAEDFRRLGVRPHECRLDVIRRAATRSARALAEQQLDTPSEQVALQLSRVATSAYRLLDPRQRVDTNQRIHVGRGFPATLTFAVQANLQGSATVASPGAPFQNNDGDRDVELTEDSDSESSNDFDWAIDLVVDDQGVASTKVAARRKRSKRTNRQRRWMLLLAAGLVVGPILALMTMRGEDSEPILPDPQASETSGPAPSPIGSIDRTPPALRQDDVPAASPPQERVEPLTTALAAEPDRSAETVKSSLSDRVQPSLNESARASANPGLPLGEPARMPAAEKTDRGQFLPDPFASSATADRSPAISDDDRINAERRQPAEPTALAAGTLEPTALAAGNGAGVDPSKTPEASGFGSADSSPPKIRSKPDEASIRAARTQLVALLPELAHAVSPRDISARIAAVESIEQQLSIGSVDYWVARLQVAELAWLVEDAAQVSKRLEVLPKHYDVPILLPLSESYIGACDLAALPETHQHLVQQGWSVADRLLIERSFEQCRLLLQAMKPSIEAVDSETYRHLLEQFLMATEQMDRLAQAERRMLDEAGRIDAEKADGKILGRFYSLMLRDWDSGLPWLVESSNPRIASVARQELKLGDDATADEWIGLSKHWMAAASHSPGRAADSMRLHAIDLMRRAVQETSGLTKLETERNIDTALELVPAFLRDLPIVKTKSKPKAEPAGATKPGLSGRISIDGKDAGVQLDYHLGVPLTQSVLDTIGQRLNRKLGPVTIRMTGEFQTDEPTVVLVSATQPQDVMQTIVIDGRAIEFAASQQNVEVSLQPGTHLINWSIDAAGLSSPASLRLQDWTSGRPLQIVQPSPSPTLPTTLTVAMVPRNR